MTLELSELAQAAWVGIRRHINAIQEGKKDSHGFDGTDGWTKHIEGASGELAVAKLLNIYWDAPVGTFKTGADVGELQVRTRSRSDYDLIVREVDRDEDVFILVTGVAPVFRVRGWITGGEAKRSEWLKTHGGRPAAYFVPQDDLKPLSSLPGIG